MSWVTLSSKIKTKLQSVSNIQSVYDYPWLSFDGYPAATITPSDMESDYETQAENLRNYIFIVRVFMNLDVINESTLEKKVDKGFQIMRSLVDEVIDEFDSDETLSGIAASMPSGKTMIAIRPVPGAMLYYEDEKMIIGEVKLNCLVSFDTTS